MPQQYKSHLLAYSKTMVLEVNADFVNSANHRTTVLTALQSWKKKKNKRKA